MSEDEESYEKSPLQQDAIRGAGAINHLRKEVLALLAKHDVPIYIAVGVLEVVKMEYGHQITSRTMEANGLFLKVKPDGA